MSILVAVILFANALFNVVAWPRFFSRVARDPRSRGGDGSRTTFYRVHAILLGIALALAALSVLGGVLVLV